MKATHFQSQVTH